MEGQIFGETVAAARIRAETRQDRLLEDDFPLRILQFKEKILRLHKRKIGAVLEELCGAQRFRRIANESGASFRNRILRRTAAIEGENEQVLPANP